MSVHNKLYVKDELFANTVNATGIISSFNVKATDRVAIGTNAGITGQGGNSVAIGLNAGYTGQGGNSVAIGNTAGRTGQGSSSVAIGVTAGSEGQGVNSVAIGVGAGNTDQKAGAVAIGYNSGHFRQGNDSIAIGTDAGLDNQADNSIVLNATGAVLDASTTGTFIKPMRNQTATNSVFYDPTSGELSYSPLDLSGISGSVTVHNDVTSAGSGAIITEAERTAITTNTANNTGSVTIHSDVSNAGSGKIISDAERNDITSNVAKLVNQTAVSTPVPITTLVGELDVAKIKSYEHNCELEFNDTDAILTADGTVSLVAPTITIQGTATTNQTSFTENQQLVSKKYVDDGNAPQNTKLQNITASAGATTLAGTTTANFIKNNYLQIGSGTSSLYMVASNLSNIAEYKDDRDVKFYGNVRVDNDITTTNLIVDATDTEDHGVTTTNLITGVVLRVRKPDGSIIMDINGSAFSTKDVRFFGDVNVDGRLYCSNIKQGWHDSSAANFIYQDDTVNFVWNGTQLQFTKVNTSIPNYWTFTNQTLKNSDVGTLSRFESGGYSSNSPSWFTHADPGYDANYDLVGNKLGVIELTLIAYQDTTLKSYSIKIISSYGTPSLSYLINVMPGS